MCHRMVHNGRDSLSKYSPLAHTVTYPALISSALLRPNLHFFLNFTSLILRTKVQVTRATRYYITSNLATCFTHTTYPTVSAQNLPSSSELGLRSSRLDIHRQQVLQRTTHQCMSPLMGAKSKTHLACFDLGPGRHETESQQL